MITLFWLAVFIAVCGIGYFLLVVASILFSKKWGTWQQQVLVSAMWSEMLPWKWLFVGVAAIIVCITL